ncbi:MAG: diacylglycerol kinase family lipid kinase [Micromonosporaceae bacterium]|nr:diacylglycerol kinase family lipid kinase [Micromonosporaceae bacterium]
MRALLVVNEQATTTSERSRDVLVRALRTAADLQVAYTHRRGHATALVQDAGDQVGLVVTHGGDGTVNEVVNGLMASGSGPADRPALGVVPGGSTNVFARALGIPPDWAEATGVILEALRDARARTIGLGRADDRYFTFCAGLGLDAAVVRRVEQARFRGRTSTPRLYFQSTLRQLASRRDRHPPGITVEVAAPDQPGAEQLATVIVQNTAPWTYLGDRPIDPNPDASFDLGLDVLAMRALRVPGAARTFGQLLAGRGAPHGRHVVRWHDLTELTLRASVPEPFQVDGDYLGERDKVQLSAVPDAVRVLC